MRWWRLPRFAHCLAPVSAVLCNHRLFISRSTFVVFLWVFFFCDTYVVQSTWPGQLELS